MASDTFESCVELIGEPDWSDALARPHVREEIANSITHGAGLLLSLAGAPLLLNAVQGRDNNWLTAGCAVYLATLVGVYAMSFLSHVCWQPRLRGTFRSLDQAAIYCFIAGTYTPFAVAYLGPSWRLLTALVWLAALAGFCSKVFARHRVDNVSVGLYVLVGWLPTLALPSIVPQISLAGTAWIIAGVAAYSAGVPFLVHDSRRWYFHSVWHLLVIAGSAAHFIAVLHYVVPTA